MASIPWRLLLGLGLMATLGLPAMTASAAPGASLVATQDMTGALPPGTTGVAMVVSADGSSVIVATKTLSTEGKLGVLRLDAATGRVLASGAVTPPDGKHGITGLALDPVRSRVWLMVGTLIYIFDATSLSLVTSVINSRYLETMVAPANGGPVYGLGSMIPGSIVKLDPNSGRVLREVILTKPTAQRPASYWSSSVSRLLIDPAGTRLFALPRDGSDLFVVDPISMTIVSSTSAGEGPDSMALSPTSGQVFVVDITDRVLRRFDMETLADQGTAPLREQCPISLTTDALGERAIVGNLCGSSPYQVFDPRNGQVLSAAFARAKAAAMWMSPDGTRVIALDDSAKSAVTGYRLQTRREVAAEKRAVTPSPSQPRQVTVSLEGASASVSWSPPANNRRSKVKQYVVTAKPGGLQCTTRSVRCTISGLERGRTYAFTVTARNTAGPGPAAVSRFVTVSAPVPTTPSAPEPKPLQDLS